jgi:hypothetical protein
MTDPQEIQGVPVSAGIPSIVVAVGMVGVILIFIIGGLVLSQAHYGHIWPASDSVNLKLS